MAAQEPAAGSTPAFYPDPELVAGCHRLYHHNVPEARETFSSWRSHNTAEPFDEVALSVSRLFEELHLQGVLTIDFFLNEMRFLHGIDGKPDPAFFFLNHPAPPEIYPLPLHDPLPI